jgi:hypothetical protein
MKIIRIKDRWYFLLNRKPIVGEQGAIYSQGVFLHTKQKTVGKGWSLFTHDNSPIAKLDCLSENCFTVWFSIPCIFNYS